MSNLGWPSATPLNLAEFGAPDSNYMISQRYNCIFQSGKHFRFLKHHYAIIVSELFNVSFSLNFLKFYVSFLLSFSFMNKFFLLKKNKKLLGARTFNVVYIAIYYYMYIFHAQGATYTYFSWLLLIINQQLSSSMIHVANFGDKSNTDYSSVQ